MKVPIATSNVRWGAVMAGVLVSTAAQIVLTMLGCALASSVLPPSIVVASSGPFVPPITSPEVGIFTAFWSLFAIVASMFAGGIVAGFAASGRTTQGVVLDGLLVWAVSVLVSLWLVAIGVTSIISLIGAGAALDPNRAVPAIPPEAAGVVRDVTRYGLVSPSHHAPALWTLTGVLAAAALTSVLGTSIGARHASERVEVPNDAFTPLRPSRA